MICKIINSEGHETLGLKCLSIPAEKRKLETPPGPYLHLPWAAHREEKRRTTTGGPSGPTSKVGRLDGSEDWLKY